MTSLSYRVQRVIVEKYKPDVGSARERELIDHADLVVSQQDGCNVLKTGEWEFFQRIQRRVLDR